MTTLSRKNGYTTISINTLPHVKFKTKLFIGFQSFIDKEGVYTYNIWIYAGTQIIKMEYEEKEVWEGVLRVLM